MIVATFNATTGWAGKNITWQDDRLVLDGHGVITAFDLMGYDGQGQLDWPSEEMRSWAAARYSWELAVATPAAVAQPAAATPEATPAEATTTPAATPAAATATPDTAVLAAPVTPPTPVTPTTVAHRPFMPETVTEEPAIAQGSATTEAPAAESTAEDDEAAAAAAETAAVAAETEMAAVEPEAAAEMEAVEPEAAAEVEVEAAPLASETEAAPPPADEVRDVLAPGGDIVELVGTAPYQEALEVIAGDTPESAPELEKWAHLIPEPDNPWDRNAVAVYIDARKIGYLPRESSAAYAALLTHLWAASRARAVCRAVVTGGSYKVTTQAGSVAEVDDEQFGVKLALAAPQHFDVTRELRQLTAEELAEGPPPI